MHPWLNPTPKLLTEGFTHESWVEGQLSYSLVERFTALGSHRNRCHGDCHEMPE
ncbi:MAG: hypothetical protein JRH20_05480 [Deltaproteobacteria bacterium]|nr:hypothetical protein [Deltaproteobacteria bacterium]